MLKGLLVDQHPIDSFDQSSGQIKFSDLFSEFFRIALIFFSIFRVVSGGMCCFDEGIFEIIIAMSIEFD